MNAFEDACEEISGKMYRPPSREEVLQAELARLRRENLRLIEELNQLKGERRARSKLIDDLHAAMQRKGK